MAEFVRAQIFGTTFEITSRYSDLQPVGMGAFGLVCSARDQLTNQNVAVKKIMKPFSTPVLAKRTYRELKLLKHLRHENVISLSDIFISPLEDIYFVTELLGTDLHRLLTSRPLEKQFIQYFLYQIMRGLKYVHSAGVVHRDLKPSNILVNENCDLKICDFNRIPIPLYLYTQAQINKKNDLSTLKYVEPAPLGSGEEPRPVTTTNMEYDKGQFRQLIKSQFMGVGMMAVMHLYFKYTNPLLIQSIIPLKGAFESNLVKIHVFGKPATGDLQRPFKAANSFLSQGQPKTDKASLQNAEKNWRGGVKEE